MSEHGRKPVVIVGAGPCGLVVAAELLRFGIPVRVLDAADEPATGSRAIILWPPTLEVFTELGIYDAALAEGIRPRALAYHMPDGKELRIELSDADQPLLLPQERTGALLVDALHRLGGKVEHATKVTGISQTADTVTITVDDRDGVESTIEADWVVAADGVGSVVRQQLGIDFVGDALPTTFLLAEGKVTGPVDRDRVHYFLGASGVLLISPLPGGLVRISGPIAPDTELSQEFVQKILDQRGPGGLTVTELTMLGTFHSQERLAATMRENRVFLVGDAAHVHSAVGGQGLNVGIQDGRNLAWKLAGHLDGRLSESVLDTYSPERRAAAEEVVKATGKMIRQAVVGPVKAKIRNAVFRLMEATGTLTKKFGPMLAGRLVKYPDVLFGVASVTAKSLPQPGTRTPTWVPNSESAGLRLITLGGAGLTAQARGLERDGVLTHEHLESTLSGFVLVRPDGFVAASGSTPADLTACAGLVARLGKD